MTTETDTDTANDYDDAFAKFSTDELPVESSEVKPETTPEPVTEAASEPVTETTPEPVVDDSGDEDEPVAAVATEDEPAPAEAGKSKVAAEDADLLEKLDRLLESRKQPEPEKQEEPEQPKPPVYTAEEQTFLEEYERDWGDVSRAEGMKRRVEYDQLVQYVFNEVAAVLRPMSQDMQALSQDRQRAQYREAVPDYEDIQGKLEAWAESQPAYLRTAYQNVIQNGTPSDVSDLVERFKRDTGASPVVESQNQKATELPTSAKKAAQALAPVSSRRSTVVSAEPDKNDFDGAFDRFAAIT